MKWNWYESDFQEPETPKYEPFNLYKGGPPPPMIDSPTPSSGDFWGRLGGKLGGVGSRLSDLGTKATTSFLPDYDPNAWYNPSPLDWVPGRFGATRKQADEFAELTKPWTKQVYEKAVQPIASPLGVAATVATVGTGPLLEFAGMPAAEIAASRLSPLLRAAQPAAQAIKAGLSSPTARVASGLGRAATATIGAKMFGEGLYGAGKEGIEFFKDPTNQRAAEIGGNLLNAGMGGLGMWASLRGGGGTSEANSLATREIEVPRRADPTQLPSPEVHIGNEVRAAQDLARRQRDVVLKIQNKIPLTQPERELATEMAAAQTQPGPLVAPPAPTESSIRASLQGRPYEPPTQPTLTPTKPDAVSWGEINQTGQRPAPVTSRVPYGPERPPAPAPPSPLQRAQELLNTADSIQKGGNVKGASILRQSVADSVRTQGYGDWANSIEAQIPGQFRNQPPPAAPPAPVAAPKGPTPITPTGGAAAEIPKPPSAPRGPKNLEELMSRISALVQEGAPDEAFQNLLPKPKRGPLAQGETWSDRVANYVEAVKAKRSELGLPPTKTESPINLSRIEAETPTPSTTPPSDIPPPARAPRGPNLKNVQTIGTENLDEIGTGNYRILPDGEKPIRGDKIFGKTKTGRYVIQPRVAPEGVPPVTPALRTAEGLKAAPPDLPTLGAKDLAAIRGSGYQVIEPNAPVPEGAKVLGRSSSGKVIIQPAPKPAPIPKPVTPEGEALKARITESVAKAPGAKKARIEPELDPITGTPRTRFKGTRPETAKVAEPPPTMDPIADTVKLHADDLIKQHADNPAVRNELELLKKARAGGSSEEIVKATNALVDANKKHVRASMELFFGKQEPLPVSTEPVTTPKRRGSKFKGTRPETVEPAAPAAEAPAPKKTRFKGTRKETEKIAAAAEEAPPAAAVEEPIVEKPKKGGKKAKAPEVEYKSPDARDIIDQRDKLDKANAPDSEYRKQLPRTARQEKLKPGETWRQRMTEQAHMFEEQAAADAEFAEKFPLAAKRPGETGAIRIRTRREARARARVKAEEDRIKFENEKIAKETGMHPSEIDMRRRMGKELRPDLTETLNYGETRAQLPEVDDFGEKRIPTTPRKKKTLDEIIQTAYNRKTARPIGSLIESSELEHFDKDPNALEKIYKGDPSTRKASDSFMRVARQAREAGTSYRNVLKKLFKSTDAEFDAVFGDDPRKIPGSTNNKPFSFSKLYEDLEHGRQNGLEVKHKTVSELRGALEHEVRGTAMRKEAWTDLRNSGHIRTSKPKGAEGEGWEKINPDLIPGQIKSRPYKLEGGEEITVTPDYWADGEAHKQLKAFYGKIDESWIKNLADAAQLPKNIFFAGGIPWTPINKHYFNIMNRAFKKGGWEEVKTLMKANKRDIMPLLRKMHDLAYEGGMQTSAENKTLEHLGSENIIAKLAGRGIAGRGTAKFVGGLQKVFEKKFFQEKLPAFKTETGWKEFERGMEAGLTRKEAMERAGKLQNVFYGGVSDTPQGWFFKKPVAHQVSRTALLAPDWHQTKYKLGTEETKALAGKSDPAYLESFRRGAATTAFRHAGRAALAAGAGKLAYDQFYPGVIPTNIERKSKTGIQRAVGIDIPGTSDELQRMPEIVYKAYKERDPGYLLRSIAVTPLNLPARSMAHLAEGHSATNEPLWSLETKFKRRITPTQATLRVLNEITQNAAPPFASVMVKYAIGDYTADQAIAEAGETPIVYHYIDQINKTRAKTFGVQPRANKKFGF